MAEQSTSCGVSLHATSFASRLSKSLISVVADDVVALQGHGKRCLLYRVYDGLPDVTSFSSRLSALESNSASLFKFTRTVVEERDELTLFALLCSTP